MLNSSRLWIVVLFACSIIVCLLASSHPSQADELSATNFTPDQFIEYEKQLNALLRTRRDEEQVFIRSVVRQVRLGRIPSRLVSTSYGWVRNNRPTTNYPFIYFERVLRLQATAINLGNEIPSFDTSIYGWPGQNLARIQNSAGIRPFSDRNVTPSAGQR